MDGNPDPSELGLTEVDLGVEMKSITNKELPKGWPKIISSDEERKAYDALFDPKEDRTKPPTHSHVERLSYELTNGDKRLRFFAVYHQRDMREPDDPNIVQYEVLERKFRDSPPQLVLYEGKIDDIKTPVTRERALEVGEPAWMLYLVQQHNANLKEGEQPIVIESGDIPNENLAAEFKKSGHSDQEINNFFVNRGKRRMDQMYEEERNIRDKYIIENGASKFKQFDRLDIVYGSGHAIRERRAWEEFFDKTNAPLQLAA